MTARVWSALWSASFVGLLLLSGCVPGVSVDGSPESKRSEPPAAPTTPEGAWSLVTGTTPEGPIVIPGGREITLEITPPEAVGRSTCNSYGARVRVRAERIRFGTVGTTL